MMPNFIRKFLCYYFAKKLNQSTNFHVSNVKIRDTCFIWATKLLFHLKVLFLLAKIGIVLQKSQK